MRGAQTLIKLLDGSRELGQVLAAAAGAGHQPREAAEQVIGLLAAAGAVHDFPAATVRALPDGPRDRLARELATVSLAHGHTDGGALRAGPQAGRVRPGVRNGPGRLGAGQPADRVRGGPGSCTGAAAEPSGHRAAAHVLAADGPGPARPPGALTATRPLTAHRAR